MLEKAGYTLEIKEYNDYVQPNVALDAGDLDANYFQHQPYLDEFNAEKKTELASAAVIHYEPFGIYAGKTASLRSWQTEPRSPFPMTPPMRPGLSCF